LDAMVRSHFPLQNAISVTSMSVSLKKMFYSETASHNPTNAVTDKIPNKVRESNRIAHYWGEAHAEVQAV